RPGGARRRVAGGDDRRGAASRRSREDLRPRLRRPRERTAAPRVAGRAPRRRRERVRCGGPVLHGPPSRGLRPGPALRGRAPGAPPRTPAPGREGPARDRPLSGGPAGGGAAEPLRDARGRGVRLHGGGLPVVRPDDEGPAPARLRRSPPRSRPGPPRRCAGPDLPPAPEGAAPAPRVPRAHAGPARPRTPYRRRQPRRRLLLRAAAGPGEPGHVEQGTGPARDEPPRPALAHLARGHPHGAPPAGAAAGPAPGGGDRRDREP